jgi:hypothetical protein
MGSVSLVYLYRPTEGGDIYVVRIVGIQKVKGRNVTEAHYGFADRTEAEGWWEKQAKDHPDWRVQMGPLHNPEELEGEWKKRPDSAIRIEAGRETHGLTGE